jgi:O-acetyl-ADP-ribose deacetylase (regulator of RNase III)
VIRDLCSLARTLGQLVIAVCVTAWRFPKAAWIICGFGRSGRQFYAGWDEYENGRRRARIIAGTRGQHRARMIAETEAQFKERGIEYQAGFTSELRELEGDL